MIRPSRNYGFLALCLLFAGFASFAAAAQKEDDWEDEDKDGRKESHFFYEDGKVARVEVDKNGDGKPDAFFHFKDEKRVLGEMDTDYDGKIDQWVYYDDKGNMRRIGRDNNKDGKVDEFMDYLQGRQVVLREIDRNYDGKIDLRKMTMWGERRAIPGQPPIPGYVTIWQEEDNDFDGKIDVYKEHGKAKPKSARIGQPIAGSAPAGGNSGRRDATEDRIKALNDKYQLS